MLKNSHEEGKTIVYFVRHGDREKISNTENPGLLIPGPKLTKLGVTQAKKCAKEFFKIKDEIDAIYCSDMTRAIETAEEIAKIVKKKPIITPGIGEFSKKIWDKKIFSLFFLENYLKYRKAIKILDEILLKNREKVIIIVSHGQVMKGFLGKKLGLSFSKIKKFDYHHCHISKLRFKGKKLDYISCFNSSGLGNI